MPPFNNYTTKAKEALKIAHELAIERGQNHVNPLHLLASLLRQEEGMVITVLERLGVDIIFLNDSVLDAIEEPETGSVMSSSYQLYLTPDLAKIFDTAGKEASRLNDEFISTEHLFLAMLGVSSEARDMLAKFKIEKTAVEEIVEELRNNKTTDMPSQKKFRAISKYT